MTLLEQQIRQLQAQLRSTPRECHDTRTRLLREIQRKQQRQRYAESLPPAA
ncbi:MAG: hypothetical protein GVY18_04535 [Bacteroidetes bacterium]|nr:hypothetical protein [Bacteroidota bacterium]